MIYRVSDIEGSEWGGGVNKARRVSVVYIDLSTLAGVMQQCMSLISAVPLAEDGV